MTELTGRELTRGKEEYTEAVVENMTMSQMRSYLYQVLYNDVSVLSGHDFAKKVLKSFGEDFYLEMVDDIVISMTDLPLDPHDMPGTPEYNELFDERARRAYVLREAMMEEDEWLCRRPHP